MQTVTSTTTTQKLKCIPKFKTRFQIFFESMPKSSLSYVNVKQKCCLAKSNSNRHLLYEEISYFYMKALTLHTHTYTHTPQWDPRICPNVNSNISTLQAAVGREGLTARSLSSFTGCEVESEVSGVFFFFFSIPLSLFLTRSLSLSHCLFTASTSL